MVQLIVKSWANNSSWNTSICAWVSAKAVQERERLMMEWKELYSLSRRKDLRGPWDIFLNLSFFFETIIAWQKTSKFRKKVTSTVFPYSHCSFIHNSKRWKGSQCPSIGKRINKLISLYTQRYTDSFALKRNELLIQATSGFISDRSCWVEETR